MHKIHVCPTKYRQFGTDHRDFCLIVAKELADTFAVDGGDYQTSRVVAASPDSSLAELLRSEVSEHADVLVIATQAGLLPAHLGKMNPEQTVAVLPAADHDAGDMIRYLLEVLERSDPDRQLVEITHLRTSLSTAPALCLHNALTSSTAVLDLVSAAVEWTASGGLFRPSAVTIVPTGSVSVQAIPRRDIGEAYAAALNLSGELAVKGWPTVRSRGEHLTTPQRRSVHESLLSLYRYPVVLTVEGGVVTDIKAVAGGSEIAASALAKLFASHSAYRRVIQLGWGVNSSMKLLRTNSEANFVRSDGNPTTYIVLGDMPETPFDLVLTCASHLSECQDYFDFGKMAGCEIAPRRRRLNRVSSASCGCH